MKKYIFIALSAALFLQTTLYCAHMDQDTLSKETLLTLSPEGILHILKSDLAGKDLWKILFPFQSLVPPFQDPTPEEFDKVSYEKVFAIQTEFFHKKPQEYWQAAQRLIRHTRLIETLLGSDAHTRILLKDLPNCNLENNESLKTLVHLLVRWTSCKLAFLLFKAFYKNELWSHAPDQQFCVEIDLLTAQFDFL